MPRRKTSNIISDVMDSAETLRKDIDAVPYEMRDKITALGWIVEDTPHGPRVKRK